MWCNDTILYRKNNNWKWITLNLYIETFRFVQFPHVRSCAVSYIRLLLDDTALNAHQFRMGLSSTRVCECGTDIEDVDHYLLRCPKYNSIRSDLLKSVQDIVTYCIRSSNQGLTTSLLLSPWNCEDTSKYDCSEILTATFQFIHKSTRQLWAIHYLIQLHLYLLLFMKMANSK